MIYNTYHSMNSFDNFRQTSSPDISVTVKTETAKKISLFSAITIVIGAIVGSGVFFKNIGVFKENHGNAYGIVLSWVIATVIALATAYTYGEITRAKTKTANSGLAGWSERYVGYKFSRFLKIIYGLFLYPIYIMATSIFCAEAILNCNPDWAGTESGINTSFWYVILIALVIVTVLIFLNLACKTFSNKLAKYTTLIKFIPSALVIVLGITLGCLKPENNLFIHPESFNPGSGIIDDKKGKFDFLGVLNSLPGIMFAFDSFLIIGNVAKDIKNPKKNIPLSIIISLGVSGILYLLITIGFCCSGKSQPYKLIEALCQDNKALNTAMKIIISSLLFICILGVLNSFLIGGTGAVQTLVNEEIMVGTKTINKIFNGKPEHHKDWILLFSVFFIYFLIISIPSGILSTDQMYDGFTSVIPTFSFMIFAFVAIMSVVNRKTQRVPVSEVSYQKFQKTAAIISAIGCFGINLYGMFYQFLIRTILTPSDNSSWGLFYHNSTTLNLYQATIVFWIAAITFIGIPFLNDLLIKCTNKNYQQKLLV